jgi:hypothetical protein
MSRRALADLSILVSLWVCADRGVDGMFGAPGSDARPLQPEPKPGKHITTKRRGNGKR